MRENRSCTSASGPTIEHIVGPHARHLLLLLLLLLHHGQGCCIGLISKTLLLNSPLLLVLVLGTKLCLLGLHRCRLLRIV